MTVRYREPDDDDREEYGWLLVALVTFLAIVIPCILCMKFTR